MKKINKKYIIFILILFISIGFAYLSTTLNISGLIGYKGNSWNIYFDNIQMITNDVSGEKPVINDNKDSIDFNITFSEPSEVYKFSVDVVNDGTIDAMLSELIKTGINSSNEEYLDYSVTYYNGDELAVNDLLKHGTKVRVIVNVEYKYTTEVLAPVGNNDYSLTLKYIQADDNANPVYNYYESDKGNTFVLNNVKANTLSNIKIYGKNEQTQYQGYQLLKKDGLSTSFSDTSFWNNHYKTSALSDGWLNVSIDNTEGTDTLYANYFIKSLGVDYLENTDYTIYVEYKNYSGTGGGVTISQLRGVESFSSHSDGGHLSFDSTNSNNHKNNSTSGTLAFLVHTKNSFDGVSLALRAFSSCAVGNAYSVDIRMTIVKGNHLDTVYSWEPYVGGIPSPNYDYPQDIHSVGEEFNLEIHNRNLLAINNIDDVVHDGIIAQYNDDGTITLNGKITKAHRLYLTTYPIQFKKGKTYTIYGEVVGGTATPYTPGANWSVLFYGNSSNLTFINTKNVFSKSYTPEEDINFVPYLWFGMNDSSNEESGVLTNYILKLQIEESDSFTSFVKGIRNSFQLSLDNIKLNGIDDYKDYIFNKDGEWFVHRNIGVKNLGGASGWYRSNTVILDRYTFISEDKPDFYTRYKVLSTHFLYSSGLDGIPGYVGFVKDLTNDILYFDYAKNGTSSAESFKSWCDSNNPYIYFRLNNPYDEKITDTNLINQLNNLINNNLVDGTNYITVSSNGVVPDIQFDYVHE